MKLINYEIKSMVYNKFRADMLHDITPDVWAILWNNIYNTIYNNIGSSSFITVNSMIDMTS